MHIYNFKINKSLVFKGILILFAIICLLLLIYSGFKLFCDMKKYKQETFVVNDSDPTIAGSSEISSEQYTNVLKAVHDNIDNYIGKEITFVGYVYKIDYLEPNQFVLARNMIINSTSQNVVVGFLCESDKISQFENLSWVKVTGTIKKGNLDGEIPIIEVTSIQPSQKPDQEFVYPPDETYVNRDALF